MQQTNTIYSPYRKSYLSWDNIERANKADNCSEKARLLSYKARAIMSVLVPRLKKTDIIFLNHKYISSITMCGTRQNNNILDELRNIFDIQYHRTIYHNGRKYTYSYAISLKKRLISENNLNQNDVDKKQTICKKISSSYIYKENKIKDRSIESNISSIVSSNKSDSKQASQETDICKKTESDNFLSDKLICSNETRIADEASSTKGESTDSKAKETVSVKKSRFFGKRSIDQFKLTEEDAVILRFRSAREFSLRFQQQLQSSIAKKYPDKRFWSKKSFISYMCKLLENEMRDASNCNGAEFTLKINLTESDKEKVIQESYLRKLENTQIVSPLWHLKKKLASVLERSVACRLLQAFKSIEIDKKRGMCRITLSSDIKLTDSEKRLVLAQVKATHERLESGVSDYELQEEGGLSSNLILIDDLEFVISSSSTNLSGITSGVDTSSNQLCLPPRKGIWGKIRASFASYLGRQGDLIDISWISKLDAKIDKEARTVNLIAPSAFVYDYISQNYQSLLTRAAKEQSFDQMKLVFPGKS